MWAPVNIGTPALINFLAKATVDRQIPSLGSCDVLIVPDLARALADVEPRGRRELAGLGHPATADRLVDVDELGVPRRLRAHRVQPT